MTQWEIWDRMFDADTEYRVRVWRRHAAAEKARSAKQGTKPRKDPKDYFAHLKRTPGDGKISRTSEGASCTLCYDEAAIARIAERTPWLLGELLGELERNKQ